MDYHHWTGGGLEHALHRLPGEPVPEWFWFAFANDHQVVLARGVNDLLPRQTVPDQGLCFNAHPSQAQHCLLQFFQPFPPKPGFQFVRVHGSGRWCAQIQVNHVKQGDPRLAAARHLDCLSECLPRTGGEIRGHKYSFNARLRTRRINCSGEACCCPVSIVESIPR